MRMIFWLIKTHYRILGKAILGLFIASALSILYFDFDTRYYTKHALSLRGWRGIYHLLTLLNIAFLYSLLIFILATGGYPLAGSALRIVVVASDCNDADPDTLVEDDASISQNPLKQLPRWYLGCGLGLFTVGNEYFKCYD